MSRGAVGLALTSFCLLAAVGFQTIKKEALLQAIRNTIQDSQDQVDKQEAQIVQTKLQVQELSAVLAPVNSKREELLKKMTEATKANQDIVNSLQTCNNAKTEAVKRKKDVGDALNKQKADHDKEKMGAEAEIKALKQQLLDRDNKVCQFVDKGQEEGRKLCAAGEAPK